MREAVLRYQSCLIMATAPLAVELSAWVRQELARDGGPELLDVLWDANGLPPIIVEKLLDRSGITKPYPIS